MPAASGALIAAIQASLANPAPAWAVQAVSEHQSVEATELPPPLAVTSRIVSLDSEFLTMQLVYVARLAPAFVSAQILIDGAAFDTTDALLFNTIDAMAAAHLGSQDAAILARLTPPPGSIFPASIASAVTFGQPVVG